MLVSEVLCAPGIGWQAMITDQDGQRPDPDRVDVDDWYQEMKIAAHLLAVMMVGPRQLVIIHPDDYGQEPA